MRPLAALAEGDVRGLGGVLFDLDETVLTRGELTREAYGALHDLRDAGLTLVAVTGRPAGWGELLARQWPVAACVVENGALYYARDERGRVARVDAATPESRAEKLAALERVVARARDEVPSIGLTDDARARVADVTWDIGEHARPDPADVARLAALVREEGARVIRSSVHLHATFDVADKAAGVVRALRDRCGIDPGAAPFRFAFVGDSGNDASCFAAFRLTFGVANVRDSMDQIAVPPRFVAPSPRGAGFAEIARAVATLRGTWTSRVVESGSSP